MLLLLLLSSDVDPLDESSTSPDFEVFLSDLEISTGIYNAPRILTWEDKQGKKLPGELSFLIYLLVSCFVGPVMDQDKIREQIGNSTGVVIFNADGMLLTHIVISQSFLMCRRFIRPH
jgi:hypothetical protein